MTERNGVTMSEEHLKTVYGFIRAYWKRHGWSPTFTEIGNGCLMKRHLVKKAVLKLQEQGKLKWTPRVLRSIVVIHPSVRSQP